MDAENKALLALTQTKGELRQAMAEVKRLEAVREIAEEALETVLLVAAEAGVHAGINGPMHSGQNSSDALDLIESMARTALARIDKEAHDA